MTKKILGVMLALSVSCIGLDSHAETLHPVDVSQMRATNVYVTIPQDHIFVEYVKGASTREITDTRSLLAYPYSVGEFVAGARAVYIDLFQDAEAEAGAVHAVADPMDMNALLQQAAGGMLGPWLHPQNVSYSTDDSTAFFTTETPNQKADSVLVTKIAYSLTPDYRGVVLAATVKFYSSALSPDKPSPYDPDSRFNWLRKPVATRVCIYQAKLLQLPEKTQAVKDQLTAVADKMFDAPALQHAIEKMNRDVGGEGLTERAQTMKQKKRYDALMAQIRDPAWQSGDVRLMSALMWSADGGSSMKQALREGVDGLMTLIAASANPQPIAGTVQAVPGTKDTLGVVRRDTDRTTYIQSAGVLYSIADGDPVNLGVLFQVSDSAGTPR